MRGSRGERAMKAQIGNRGVSPVIGTIMMVAIVVIAAAVVGGVVFAAGDISSAQQAITQFDNLLNHYMP